MAKAKIEKALFELATLEVEQDVPSSELQIPTALSNQQSDIIVFRT